MMRGVETPGAKALREEYEAEQERADNALAWGFYLRRGLTIRELQANYSYELDQVRRRARR
jgi:hypothetical protein